MREREKKQRKNNLQQQVHLLSLAIDDTVPGAFSFTTRPQCHFHWKANGLCLFGNKFFISFSFYLVLLPSTVNHQSTSPSNVLYLTSWMWMQMYNLSIYKFTFFTTILFLLVVILSNRQMIHLYFYFSSIDLLS